MIRFILAVVFLAASVNSSHAWDVDLTPEQEAKWQAALDAGNRCTPEPQDLFCREDFTRPAVLRYELGTGFDMAKVTMNYIPNSQKLARLGFLTIAEKGAAQDKHRAAHKAYLAKWGIEL